MTAYSTVTVTLEDRDDGGLRVYSDDLPGLILSGPNKDTVCNQIAPAIAALLEHKGISVTSVSPRQPLPDVVRQPSPRDVDMSVQHEMYIVVLANQNSAQHQYQRV